MSSLRFILTGCLQASLVGMALSPHSAAAQTVAEVHHAMVEEYRAELEQLAKQCDQQGLTEQAEYTRNWLPAEQPLTLFVPLFSHTHTELPAGDETNAALVEQWREAFLQLRSVQAERLFALLGPAVAEKQYVLGFGLVHETLRENPDHEAARLLFGYKKYEGRWFTQFELVKTRGNQVWDSRFGWQLKTNLHRYERGERQFKGRWISAEENNRALIDIAHGWDIMTEHYRVRTNYTLEEGVKLAEKLERLYEAWRQIFVRFCFKDDDLEDLLTGGGWPRRSPVRHQVVFFRNRQQYVLTLKPRQPYIELTTGYYEKDQRTAWFYAGNGQDEQGDQNDLNLYHEATHQLFSETRRPGSDFGRDANFWVIEGIACFMESVNEGGTYCTVGGADQVRLRHARYRLLRDDVYFYVPLAELTAKGMLDIQQDAEHLSYLYGEFSGLTYFLMFADGGRYRQALVDYLSEVYGGRAAPTVLADLTGATYGELDLQYRRFMESVPIKEGPESDPEQESKEVQEQADP